MEMKVKQGMPNANANGQPKKILTLQESAKAKGISIEKEAHFVFHCIIEALLGSGGIKSSDDFKRMDDARNIIGNIVNNEEDLNNAEDEVAELNKKVKDLEEENEKMKAMLAMRDLKIGQHEKTIEDLNKLYEIKCQALVVSEPLAG